MVELFSPREAFAFPNWDAALGHSQLLLLCGTTATGGLFKVIVIVNAIDSLVVDDHHGLPKLHLYMK